MSKQPIIEHLQKAGDIVDLVTQDDYLIITYRSEDQRVNSLKLSGHHFTQDYDLQIEPLTNEELEKTKDKTEDFNDDFEIINDVDDDVRPLEVQLENTKEPIEDKPEPEQQEVYEEIAPAIQEQPKEEMPEKVEEVKNEEPFQEIDDDEMIEDDSEAEERLGHSCDQAQKNFTKRCLLVILGGWAILLILQKFY